MKRTVWIAAALGAAVLVSAEVRAARPFWALDFKHTDLRYVTVGAKVYAYMTYEVTNKSGAERKFFPIFRVETETQQITYAMAAPEVAAAVRAKQRHNYLDVDQISVAIADGETRIGVAIFRDLDPEADRVKVYVTGLTDNYRYQDEDNRKGFQRMMWKIEWYRPGDAANRVQSPVQTVADEWYWRSTGVAATAPDQMMEEPVRAPAEVPAKPTPDAGGTTSGGAASSAGDPKDTIKRMFASLEKGDRAVFLSCFDASTEEAPLLGAMADAMVDATATMAAFQKAVKAKFGDDGWKKMQINDQATGPFAGKDVNAMMEKVTVKVDGDKAEAVTEGDPEAMHLVKKEGAWKISAADLTKSAKPEEAKVARAMMEGMVKALRAALTEVNKPDATAESVQMKLQEELAKLLPLMGGAAPAE